MTRVLSLLGLGAILAIVKAMVAALALGALLAALICLARWPRESLAFAIVLILGGLASARPGLALLIVTVGIVVLGGIRASRPRSPDQLKIEDRRA